MKKITIVGLVLAVALAVAASTALAQANGYSLSWWTADGGGATALENNGYTLGGTAGQPDAEVLSSGEYTLAGGFWQAAGGCRIYLPLVVKD